MAPYLPVDSPDIHDGIAGAGAEVLEAGAGKSAGEDGALLGRAQSAGAPRCSRDLRIEEELWNMNHLVERHGKLIAVPDCCLKNNENCEIFVIKMEQCIIEESENPKNKPCL